MKQTINMTGILPKTSQKSGKTFWVIGTDKGDMTCWSESVAGDLQVKLSEKKPIEVDVNEQGDFKTIRAIWTAGYVEPVSKKFEKQEFKMESMYISYAKDIFIAILNSDDMIGAIAKKGNFNQETIMDTAIGLVDQAKAHFSKGGA